MRTAGRARRGTRATAARRRRERVVPRDAGHRGQRVRPRLNDRGVQRQDLPGPAGLTSGTSGPSRGPLPDGGRAGGLTILFEVTLVVLLGPVKRGRRGDLRDDLPLQRWLLGVARRDRGFLLAGVMVEDRRPVLAAQIEPLAVAGGRIVDPPEHLEQFRVADLGRV